MEQETETKMVQQDEVTNGSNETPAQSGCLNTLGILLIAILGAFMVGVGICAGGIYITENIPSINDAPVTLFYIILFYIWLGASFIVPIIVFFRIFNNYK